MRLPFYFIMSVVWKSFTAVEVRAAFFVTAPYSCWDKNVLAVQSIGVTVPFPLCVGAGECDTGPWWPVPIPAFLCTHKTFRNYFIRSGSSAILTVVP